MGVMHYAGTASFEFEDLVLTQLRTVIFAKFNLQESLVFTWNDKGHQRSIWLHPTLPLHFEFDAETVPDIVPAWVEQMIALANTPTGLRLVERPESG